jgi:hypothetical protein
MIAQISLPFWALSGRELQLMACCGCPRDTFRTNRACGIEEGLLAGGGSWLDGAKFPQTPLSVSKIVSGPEHFSAHARALRRRTLDQPSRCTGVMNPQSGSGSASEWARAQPRNGLGTGPQFKARSKARCVRSLRLPRNAHLENRARLRQCLVRRARGPCYAATHRACLRRLGHAHAACAAAGARA